MLTVTYLDQTRWYACFPQRLSFDAYSNRWRRSKFYKARGHAQRACDKLNADPTIDNAGEYVVRPIWKETEPRP